MMRTKTGKPQTKGILAIVVAMLVVSGSIRLGSVGIAVAKNSQGNTTPSASPVLGQCTTNKDVETLMELLKKRDARITAREVEQESRQVTLDESEKIIRENIEKLKLAEMKLANTIKIVGGASVQDIERLIAVYEAMKPKDASLLFEKMAPDFAAGFLAKMSASAAAGIMSGLTADKAYEVSVVLAGRNAKAPKDNAYQVTNE